MTLLCAEGLQARLGGRAVLRGLDAAIGAGEIVTVIGPNGSGKSTLLRALIGVVQPSGGVVRRKPGLVIGYVPQRLALDPTMPMTVGRFLDLPTRTDRARRAAALARVGAEGLESRPMADLSGGQFQRAMLARALIPRPDLLMLDEPTQSLDQSGAAAFYRLIDSLRKETGCGVLMISHDIHVVMASSDRVICLREGRIGCQGAPAQVASAPQYRALFGEGAEGALALYRHHDASETARATCSTIS